MSKLDASVKVNVWWCMQKVSRYVPGAGLQPQTKAPHGARGSLGRCLCRRLLIARMLIISLPSLPCDFLERADWQWKD
eukprot:14221-Eustigmatos_ZCMA.PRE.1